MSITIRTYGPKLKAYKVVDLTTQSPLDYPQRIVQAVESGHVEIDRLGLFLHDPLGHTVRLGFPDYLVETPKGFLWGVRKEEFESDYVVVDDEEDES